MTRFGEPASEVGFASASALRTATCPHAEALDDTGVSRQQAHRFPQLEAVPRETFEQALAKPERPSRWALLSFVKGLAVAKLSDGAKLQWVFGTDFVCLPLG